MIAANSFCGLIDRVVGIAVGSFYALRKAAVTETLDSAVSHRTRLKIQIL